MAKANEHTEASMNALLDREIAASLRRSVTKPHPDFADMLMSEIAEEELARKQALATAPSRSRIERLLPAYLIGLGLALIAVLLVAPAPSDGSFTSSGSSITWTIVSIGVIAMLGLTQLRRVEGAG
jgi:cytochrome c biogenesis protein CcdA